MSIVGHTVRNAGVTVLYADLSLAKQKIILYILNVAPSGTRNQNWRFIPVNSDQNLYNIQNVLTGLYASVANTAAGQVVIPSPTAFTWRVTVVGNYSANWIIQVPHTNLVWNVPAKSPVHTNVTIAAAENGNLNQQWTLANVQV